MSIRTQLVLLAVTGILLLLIVGSFSIYAKRQADVALAASSILTTTLRNHGEADMMHDALRGDVYEAVLAGLRGDAAHIDAARKEFAEHAANFVARIEANGRLDLDQQTRASLNALQGPLEAYLHSAREVLDLAGDSARATQKIKAFQDAFEALEKPMGELSDQIERLAKQRNKAVDDAMSFSELATLTVTLIGVILMSIMGITIYNSIIGSLNDARRAVNAFFAQRFRGSNRAADGTTRKEG
jgi:methyl-accepting chemotaxis protein